MKNLIRRRIEPITFSELFEDHVSLLELAEFLLWKHEEYVKNGWTNIQLEYNMYNDNIVTYGFVEETDLEFSKRIQSLKDEETRERELLARLQEKYATQN